MQWELYAIAVVAIVWFFHSLIRMGYSRIQRLRDYYSETNIPIVFESGWSKEKVVFFKYVNVSEMPIVGFEIMLEITNEGGENEFDEYWISLETDPLRPFIGRSIKLDATLLDVKKQEIINALPMKVQFLDGSIWNIK